MPTENETPAADPWQTLHIAIFLVKLVIVTSVILLNIQSYETQAEATATTTEAGFSLQSIHRDIVADYQGVSHMRSADLEILLQLRTDIVLFDVRELDEFAVSRLDGATRIEPDIGTVAFIERYSAALKNKVVIFYCSVGVRSSALAHLVQDALLEAGAGAVYNLEGGIFNWHNEFRALAGDNGATAFVHPYSDYWGQLLTRRDKLRYAQA
jgi:rhodanese-related sulfurtransferase